MHELHVMSAKNIALQTRPAGVAVFIAHNYANGTPFLTAEFVITGWGLLKETSPKK